MSLRVCLFTSCIAAALLLVVQTPHASAAKLATDDFSNDGQLTGSTPDFNAAGNDWTGHDGSSAIQVASGKARVVHASGSTDDSLLDFGEQPNTSVVYARYTLHVPSNGNTAEMSNLDPRGTIFSSIRSRDPDDDADDRARVGFLPSADGAGGGDFRLAISNLSSDLGANGTAWGQELNFDTDYVIVSAINTATNTGTMWIDPTDINSTSVSSTAGTPDGEAYRFQLLQADNRISSGSAILDVSNLCIADNFNHALHCVPEPTTLVSCFAAALVGLVGRRSRS